MEIQQKIQKLRKQLQNSKYLIIKHIVKPNSTKI